MRPITDVNDQRLVTGTPEEQAQARREWQRHRRATEILKHPKLTEIPRSEFTFGRYVIEHTASANGDYYLAFGGDPGFIGDDVVASYVTATGDPVLLQRTRNPSSRAELERMRAQREERKATRAAAAKAHNEECRKALAGR